MTTIEEVVKMWDEKNPKMQTEVSTEEKHKGKKIKSGRFYGRFGEEAAIKLSDKYLCEPWGERTCYVFGFNSDEQTKKPIKIEISFQRRIKEHPNTQAFYERLKRIVNNNNKFTVSKGRINPNHLVLKRIFPLNSSAQDICNGMRELINLTQTPICEFLEGKDKEKPPAKNEEKIFPEIMKKYGIEKNENKGLYGKCEEIYSQTIEILENLHIGSEDSDELEVSYYTKKSIAQDLLIAPNKDEHKCKDFRLYYTHEMNDPSEGKTLLSFLGINNEDLKLPETLPFIACFSLEVNSLNQFRLYGNDNNKEATGVSIVFRFDFFDESINREQEKTPLYRCVYINPDNEQIKISFSKKEEEEDLEWIKDKQEKMDDLFKKLKKNIKELFDININNLNIDKTELVKDLIINIRYLVKDYAFTEERECRIINMINKKDGSIEIDGERLYINIGEIKAYVKEIYFAPLAGGKEVFEAKTNIDCIRSRHPYKSTRP